MSANTAQGRLGDHYRIAVRSPICSTSLARSTASYVRNIRHDPHVRVRMRMRMRMRQSMQYRWVTVGATVLPGDDPLTRQRRIVRWHPLRAFDAMNVRLLGADLLTVHIHLGQATPVPGATGSTELRQPPDPAVHGYQRHRQQPSAHPTPHTAGKPAL